MTAEYDELPEEARAFNAINIVWLTSILSKIEPANPSQATSQKAHAIFAAIGGAQLLARSAADTCVYDDIIETYRTAGLIPSRK